MPAANPSRSVARRRWAVPAALLLVVAGSLAACGDDDDDGGAVATTAAAGDTGGGGAGTVTLEAADFSFSPTDLQAPAGSVTVEVTNSGDTEHNLTIEDLDVDQDVEAGENETVTFDAEAGTYEFFCEYHPTQMRGTITIG